MKHIWTVLCEKSSIDFESNSLSMFNCIEEIQLVVDKNKISFKDKLVIPVNLQIVSYWSVQDFSKNNTLEIKGELVDPEEVVINSYENLFPVKKGIKRFRNRTNVAGIPITKSGRYYFNILQKQNNKYIPVAEIPLDVDLSFKELQK